MAIKISKFFSVASDYFSTQTFKRLLNKSKVVSNSRFVFIVSFPRSGTTALGSLLQQPNTNVNYYGEFFDFHSLNGSIYKISRHYPFLAFGFIAGVVLQKINWRPYRFENLRLDPDRVLNSLSTMPGTHVFKIFPNHISYNSLEIMLKKFKPDILFIRRNHLDRLVSHKKAKATGVWHGLSTDSVKVEINEVELDNFVKDYTDFYRKILYCASSNSIKIFDVEYENLFQPGKIVEVMSFILDDRQRTIDLKTQPKTVKQDLRRDTQQSFLIRTSGNGMQKVLSDFDFPRIVQ
jgi:LPS sulfotransferase NodH